MILQSVLVSIDTVAGSFIGSVVNGDIDARKMFLVPLRYNRICICIDYNYSLSDTT
jgi:hypothetical protein